MTIKFLKLLTVLQCSFFVCFAGIENYNIKWYDKNSDFFGDFIYTIVQDADGYLWVGTDQGLHQFDGKNLFNINRKDSTINNLVTAAVVPKDKGLFFGYLKGGLSKYKNGKYNKIFTEKDIRSQIVKIEENKNGTFWVLTANEGMIRVKTDSIDTYDYRLLERTLLRDKICYDFEIYEDNLFIATSEGLIHYKIDSKDKLKFIGMVKGTEYIPVLTLFTDHLRSRHSLWVGTEEHGLMDLKLDEPKFEINKHEILEEMTIHSIAEDDYDNLWVGTKFHGLVKIDFNKGNRRELQYTFFNKDNGFKTNQIKKVFVDRENEIWVGTFGAGLVQITEKYIHHYELNSKLRTEGINSIGQLNHTNLIIGTDNGLVKTYHPNGLDSLNFEYSTHLKGKQITTVVHTKSNEIWVGTNRDGIYKLSFDLEKIEKVNIGRTDGIFESVRYMTEDLEGNIWASLKGNGVIKIDREENKIKKFNTRNQFYHNEIYHIFPDSKGRIWFSARSVGIALMDKNGSIRYLSQEKEIPIRDVNAITEDALGNIWIASYGNGLWKLKDKELTQYQKKGGLLSDYCNSIAIDLQNNVWVSHRMGVSTLNVANDLIRTYNNASEMGENEVLLNSTFTDDVGDIWFGNAYGITKIDKPDVNFRVKNLNTLITNIRIDHKEEDLWKYSKSDSLQGFIPEQLDFPYDKNNVVFDFIAIHFRTPEAVHYQYKLEGFDKEWSEILRDNKANYTNLPEGNYRFVVKESDDPNYWMDETTSVSFVISPAYWKTLWFTSAELGIMLLLIITTIILSQRLQSQMLTKILIFACVFTIFEYIHTQLEPYMDDIAGGPAIFQVLINLLLALMLFPIEVSIMSFLNKKRENRTTNIVGSARHNSARNSKVQSSLKEKPQGRNTSIGKSVAKSELDLTNTDTQKALDKYMKILKSDPKNELANFNVGAIHINLAKSFYDRAKNPSFVTNGTTQADLILKGDNVLRGGLTYMEKANSNMGNKKGMSILMQMYKKLKMHEKAELMSKELNKLKEKEMSTLY